MSRAKARADRIREQISITAVLASYGYLVQDGMDRQQQFPCDLHGDGSDSKPSARVYPENNQWYCFACGMSRDAIQTVREKENLDFREACDQLEKRFRLPPLPWTDEGEEEKGGPEVGDLFVVPDTSREDLRDRVRTLLLGISKEKSMPLAKVLGFWEEFDRLAFYLEKGSEEVVDDFLALRDRLVRGLRGRQEDGLQ